MAPVTDTTQPYQIIGPAIHQNAWSDELQAVVPGTKITARWTATGDVIHVFVPDSAQLDATADAFIRFRGKQLDDLRKLGG